MNGTAPEWGAGSDESTGRLRLQVCLVDSSWWGSVRTGLSYADPIQLSALSNSCGSSITLLGLSRSQSERGLDSADPSPKGERSARASGIRRPEGAERVAVAVCNLPTTLTPTPSGVVLSRSEGSTVEIGGGKTFGAFKTALKQSGGGRNVGR